MLPKTSQTQECNSGPLLKSLNSEFVTILAEHYNWASVSEPHTCDFNATFSLYIVYMLYVIYLHICDRHCTSNIAINISIFHLGLIRGAEQSAPPIVEATAHRGRAVNLRACALAV